MTIGNAVETFHDKIVRAVGLGKQIMALTFFSGHGVTIGGKNPVFGVKMPEMVPTDEAGVETNRVKPEKLLRGKISKYLSQDGQQQKLCMCNLDCCWDIPKFGSTKGAGSEGGLAPMENRGGTIVLYSCDIGKTANNNPNGDHGTLMTQLLKFMNAGTKPAEMFSEVSRTVATHTGQEEGPWQLSNYFPRD